MDFRVPIARYGASCASQLQRAQSTIENRKSAIENPSGLVPLRRRQPVPGGPKCRINLKGGLKLSDGFALFAQEQQRVGEVKARFQIGRVLSNGLTKIRNCLFSLPLGGQAMPHAIERRTMVGHDA